MNEFFQNLGLSLDHIKAFNTFFSDINNYVIPTEQDDFDIYNSNLNSLNQIFSNIKAFDELYNEKNRQMILADLFEYIFLGRGFYAMGNRRKNIVEKETFVKGILNFVNLLMCYESITVMVNRRNAFLRHLVSIIPSISTEEKFAALLSWGHEIGIPDSQASKPLNNYFDKLFPKTAGGLWHELLVYVFILRNNFGYVLPLLLHQRIYSKEDHLVPPDFFLITLDKRLFGIEVGSKKEIQSGSFSLKTSIPTATIDTINSRNSDRCPICKKWINFCPFVIDKFSDFASDISRSEVRCLTDCNIYTSQQIANGDCKYSKYSRSKIQASHGDHLYADGKHYHYSCVLNNVSPQKRQEIINAQDNTAIKTHLPYYQGLEELL